MQSGFRMLRGSIEPSNNSGGATSQNTGIAFPQFFRFQSIGVALAYLRF
jgi:hypothetical protein